MNAWRRAVVSAIIGLRLTGACEAAEPADSGLALAYPLEGIQIDGDLSDWPAELPRYPVAVPMAGRARNAQDCSAEFRVGYHERDNALYVAVEMRDTDVPQPEDGSIELFTNELAIVLAAIPGAGRDPLIAGFLRGSHLVRTVTLHGLGNWHYEEPLAFEAAESPTAPKVCSWPT